MVSEREVGGGNIERQLARTGFRLYAKGGEQLVQGCKQEQADLTCSLKGHCGYAERRDSQGKNMRQIVHGDVVVVRAHPVEERMRNGQI